MSLETRIEELNTTIKALIEIMQSQQVKPEVKQTKPKKEKEKAAELPVESFIEETKVDTSETCELASFNGQFLSLENVLKKLDITKADILEIAKEKLKEGKATKEEIKGIITAQGFDSLNDITNQSDFEAILNYIKVL